MKKVFLSALIALVPALVLAAPSEGNHTCDTDLRSQCWKPAEHWLEQRKLVQPADELLIEYLGLTRLALKAGDLSDALRFQALVDGMLADGILETSPEMSMFKPLLGIHASIVNLGARKYDVALARIDNAIHDLTVMNSTIASDPRVLLTRSAVLVGLGRHDEANELLVLLENKLDLDGAPATCGLGELFIQTLHPFEAGMRIAGYYTRTGREAQAQMLFKTMERKRIAAGEAARHEKEPFLRRWAHVPVTSHGFDPYGATLGLPE